MPHKPIKRSNLSEQLSDILKELIINETYKDGDKLPSEMELTEIYSVSRLTVRAALQRLNALGLVTTKPGNGTYVNEFRIDNYLNDVSTLILQPNMMDNVRDFRKLIDIECLRLAIKNASYDDLEEFKKICDNHTNIYLERKNMDDSLFRKLAESDFNIHFSICNMSENSLLIQVYQGAKDLLVEYVYTILKIRYKRSLELYSNSFFEGLVRSHQSFYDVIKEGDFIKAKKYYLNHIDYQVLALSVEDFDE